MLNRIINLSFFFMILISTNIYPQTQPLPDKLYNIIINEGIDNAVYKYWDLKENNPGEYDFGESQLNTLGYRLLGEKKYDAAEKILKLNIEAFPESPNVYDSYAESQLLQGNEDKAVEYYRKCIEILDSNPDFPNAGLLKNNASTKIASLTKAREFDFWLGKWKVDREFFNGSRWLNWTDTARVAKVADGNAIIDYNDDPKSPNRYLFMRTYNANTDEWEITGTGSRNLGGFTVWKGKFNDGTGTFYNTGINSAGQSITTKITFYDIKDDSFLWKFEISFDDGNTWQATFKNKFTKISEDAGIVIH